MPRTQAADNLHAMKYRERNEDFKESQYRFAFGLKDDDKHYHQVKDIVVNQRFLGGGRTQGSIGATRKTTAFNCFVSGTVPDSYTDKDNDQKSSIMHRADQAAATMRMGGGIGYDFSTIRPRGDLIRKLQSQATGPVNFMRIFNEVCLCTSSSGHRRGAQMGVLRVDHPDIEEFIGAKQDSAAQAAIRKALPSLPDVLKRDAEIALQQFNSLTGFNISIAVTDGFMEAALTGKEFDLRFNGTVYRTIDAAELWEKIMRSTWDYAEPGVIFIDRINEMNNLAYCETIASTNPCSEQPLPPFGACLLGSFCLPNYCIKNDDYEDGVRIKEPYYFDWNQFREDIPPIVRAMDNVTDRTRYPLAEQRAEAISKRRMGLGITGLANAADACGFGPYGSIKFLEFERKILETLRDETYRASVVLAREKGPFPLFDAERYIEGKFIKTLPDEILKGIKEHGIRNSHLTSIAPTGTISMCADNVSSSIEPVFSYRIERPVNTPTGMMTEVLEDFGAAFMGIRGKLAKDVTAAEHVGVLTTAQRFVDSAVSKTVNMDGEKMEWTDFKGLYQQAFEGGAKGCTTFNIHGKRMALLSDAGKDEAICSLDPDTGRRECA